MKYDLNGPVKAVQIIEKDGVTRIGTGKTPKWVRKLIDCKRLVPADPGVGPRPATYYLCTEAGVAHGHCLHEDGSCYAWDAHLDAGDWIIRDACGAIHCTDDASFRSMFKVSDR